jgi:hypothetical protein
MSHLQLTTRLLLLLLLCTVFAVRPLIVLAADQAPVNQTPADGEKSNSITGLVWMDLNRNAQHEGQEPHVAGQLVFVTPDIESDFAQVLVLTTNAQGEFSATNLASGRYRVWAATQSEERATIVHLTGDRAVMTVELPLVGFTLYIPQVTH